MGTTDEVRGGLRRADAVPLLAIVAVQVALFAWIIGAATERGLIPFGGLGVYYDGSFYVEIAKSFPLPYGPDALDYTSHAPGYAFLIWGIKGLTPGAWVDWGLAALLASWIPAALASVAFWVLCRQVGLDPLLPTLVFAFANPRWLQLAATPHSASLAVLLAVLALLAYYRGRVGRAALWLSLGTLARYPTLLSTAAIAFGLALSQAGPLGAGGVASTLRGLPWRGFFVLTMPAFALAALNLYLYATVPDFRGVWAAHAPFWDTPLGLTVPFSAAFEEFSKHWGRAGGQVLLSLASIAVYAGAVALAFWRGERRHRVLGVWVGIVLLFHSSLSGTHSFWEISRLAILAWPAAVLVYWLRFGPRIPSLAVYPACAALAACGLWFAQHNIGWAMLAQDKSQSLSRLHVDEPHFENFRAERQRQRR
ncbi:MAG: hypothetical protein JRG76_18960 [Deltaproteobacteria bacterium]|nr:hypothetical protein [Deltaproteobacteria bacterium]MBW2416580.1 hypothetical protein [Deltaproteobacteria bacterium]